MRKAERARKTNETDIELAFTIDGEGQADIQTDVPFMTHMLDLFTKHGQFDLSINAKGDVDIDDHHTTEDIGICLGQALLEALGDKKGIKRYGSAFVPMDEALAQVVILGIDGKYDALRTEKLGSFRNQLRPENSCRVHRNFICAGTQNRFHIAELIDAAADCKRNRKLRGNLLHHINHRFSSFMRGGNIEKNQFIRAFLVIQFRQFNRVTGIF